MTWNSGWNYGVMPYTKKTAAPAVTDDSYPVPFLWVDETNDKFYLLIDNTSGAAVWQELAYGGGDVSFEDLTVTGSQTVNVTTVAAATYDILATDYILNVTYTGTGTVAIDFKTAQIVAGRVIHIKDAGGGATTYNITISTEGAETIDGAATAVISTDYNSVTLYCDGTNLFII